MPSSATLARTTTMHRRAAPVGALALLALLAATPLSAQTFLTQDTVIRRIYAEGMENSNLVPEAHALFDSIGPRLMGTPDLKRAQDWLVDVYESWGIDAREEQYGTWRGWVRGPSHIDLVSPRVRTLQGQMVGYSPGTGGKDVELKTVILPRFRDSTEFVQWLPMAKGKLVMISAGLPTCRPQDDWAANATPASKAHMDSVMVSIQSDWASVRVRPGEDGANAGVRGTGYSAALGGGELGVRLEQGGAAGIITSRPKLPWQLGGGLTPEEVVAQELDPDGRAGYRYGNALNTGWGAMEVFETYNTKTPAIALDCEDYGLVFRLTENGDEPKLRLNLQGKLLGEQPVYNVIATIPGSERPDEYVMMSAHFDSWDGSSGATDNGTGTLTMLEAMRILKQVYPHPKRTILVGHWSGEEEGEVGSKAFTEDHPEVLAGLEALFNQDNGTGQDRAHRRRRTGARPRAREPVAVQRPPGVAPADQRRPAGGAGPAGRRRQRRLLLRLPRAPRLRPGRPVVGLRHHHLAHRAGHVRQGRVRRPALQRDLDRHAGLPGVGRPGPHPPGAGGPGRPGRRALRRWGVARVREGAPLHEPAAQVTPRRGGPARAHPAGSSRAASSPSSTGCPSRGPSPTASSSTRALVVVEGPGRSR